MNVVTTTTPSPKCERRRAERFEYNAEIRLHRHDELILLATAENISNTGLMVTRFGGQPAFGLGELLQCQMTDGPHPPINAACRVVWSRIAQRPDKIAMGLEFEEVTDTSSIRLGRLLRRTETASNVRGIKFDPFCESGTWSPEELLTNDVETSDDTVVDRTPLGKQKSSRPLALAIIGAVIVVVGALFGLFMLL